MEYTIKHNEDLGSFMVTVCGEHRRPDDSIVLQELARNTRSESGCSRFLFDMREATIIGSTLDIFCTGTNPVEQKFEHDFRIALVYSGNMHDHNFMENVVVNRGYVLRVFPDIEEATSWLSGDD